MGVAVTKHRRKVPLSAHASIRAAAARGESLASIGSLYGVPRQTIWAIVNPSKHAASCARWRRENADKRRARSRAARLSDPVKCAAAQADWYLRNRERARKQAEAWKAANPEACAAMQHRRRARGWLGTCDIANVMRTADGVCSYCLSPAKLTVDHVQPVSRGGSNDATNLVAACGRCNSAKRDKTALEFFCKLPRLGHAQVSGRKRVQAKQETR